MQSAIDGLLKKDQIVPDDGSLWLAKLVLAPKPHQEEITGAMIDEFLWRFYVSYIQLNSITKVIPYPIPRCDDAIQMRIGKAAFKIIMDAFSGYHQIKMDAVSSSKKKPRRSRRKKIQVYCNAIWFGKWACDLCCHDT